jgi:hypothetical protein
MVARNSEQHRLRTEAAQELPQFFKKSVKVRELRRITTLYQIPREQYNVPRPRDLMHPGEVTEECLTDIWPEMGMAWPAVV